MLHVAFAGTFAASVEPRVRDYLARPCDVTVTDEAGVTAKMFDVDVLVTMVFTAEMAGAAKRLRLVQVPGAGLDRIERSALPRERGSRTCMVTRSVSRSMCSARC